MKLKELIVRIFESIIKKYNLQVSAISENEVALFSDKYILSYLLHSGELDLVYIEKKENGALYQYNIDSFIADSISEEDRIQIKGRLQKKSGIEIDLALLAYTLEKKWKNLLAGEKEWIKEYQDFSLYIPPQNITQLKAAKYKEK